MDNYSVLNLVKGYTKNQAVKNNPMDMRTNVRCGNTAGLTGLTYLLIWIS